MREMKDSGVEWIGEIPAGWEVRKVKHYYKMQTGFTPDTSKQDFYDDENGFDWVNISDLSSCRTIASTKNKISQLYINTHYPQIIPKGSLLYSFKLSVGQVAFAGKDLYSNEAIASFVFNKSNNLNFLYYSSYMIVNNANENIYGAKLLNQELIKNAYILFPPLPTQQRIADYLDNKCAKIDAIIAHERTVIEKLKEYKLSIITEAVTKGLNPNVKMKDSGIEWIGEIPEHWGLVPFKYILNERTEKNIPIKTDERLSLSIDKGVTLYAEKTTNLDRFKDDVSQYKLAHVGDFVLNSMNMIVGAVGISNYYGCVSPAYYTYYDNEENHVSAIFCDYLFRSKTIKKVLFSLGKGIMAIDRGNDKINTCRLKVSRDDLRSLKLPLPKTNEQITIIDFLDKECSQIDAAIAKKQSVIDKITEYKKSLIYEVVTGKKEV